MKQKLFFTLCMAILFAFSIEEIQAQTEKPSKTVIVKKIKVDEKGNETIDVEEYKGEAAQRYINSEESLNEEITIDVKVELDEEGNDRTTITQRKQYRMVVKDDDGNEKLMEWDGEGEMPKDMKKYMEEHNIDIDNDEDAVMTKRIAVGDNSEDYEIIVKDEKGEKKVMKWDGKGEMPEEMKKRLADKNIDLNSLLEEIDVTKNGEKEAYKMKFIDESGKETVMEWDGDGEMPADMKKHMQDHDIHINKTDEGQTVVKIEEHVVEDKNKNKAQLGVMIENGDGGAKIIDFAEGSNAQKAGLMKGDIISLINGKQVTDIESLVNALTPFKAGDTVKLSYIRGDLERTIPVLLSPRDPKKMKSYKWKSVDKKQ